MPQPQKKRKFLQVVRGVKMTVTVGTLATIIEANPSHPNVKAFRSAVEDYPPEHEVVVEKEVLRAIMENREIVKVKTNVKLKEGWETQITRRPGKTYSGPVPTKMPLVAGINAPDDYEEEVESVEFPADEDSSS